MPLYNNDHGNLEGKSDDDHSQYPLLAGRSGGQSLTGGTSSGERLILKANTQAWDPSNILADRSVIEVDDSTIVFTGQTSVQTTGGPFGLLYFGETITSTTTNGGLPMVVGEPQFIYTVSQNLALAPTFYANITYRPATSGIADSANNLFGAFLGRAAMQIDHNGTSTHQIHTTYNSQPWFRGRVSGKTGTAEVARFANYRANTPVVFNQHVQAGWTVTNFIGFLVDNPSTGGGGVITNNIGVDIASLTAGTNNIGIRNASTTVNTPATAQNITAATQAITVASTTKQLTANASYTLTSAPTIADGVDGQVVKIINVDTADTITLQDQGTLANSNLRLTANTVALAPRQSIELTYSATVGDWVQTGNLVAVL